VSLPGREHDLARGKRTGAIELVRCDEHRVIVGAGVREHLVEHGTSFRIESGMRLVEEEKPWLTSKRDSQRQSPTLASRETTMRHVCERRQSYTLECSICDRCVRTRRARREVKVLADREVVITKGLVTDECESTSVFAAIASEIVAEHLRLTFVQRDQTGDQAKQRRLSGTVPAREQHDLSRRDIKIDTGERREAAEQAHSGAETNNGLHSASGGGTPSVRIGLRNGRTDPKALEGTRAYIGFVTRRP
jgi:hypothetical protein